jgi:hypothetical protein
VAPWPMARRAQTRSIMHQTLNDFFLCDLDDERNLFCRLTVVRTYNVRPTTRRQLGRSSLMVGAAFGGAVAPGTTLVVVVMAGPPPPSGGSTRDAPVRWVDGAGS